MITNITSSKHDYQNELKETILFEGAVLEGKVSNHIIVLGYIEGLYYFIDSVRLQSDIPIIVCDK